MFIAAHAARLVKLRRSGMFPFSPRACQGSEEAWVTLDTAPTELGREFGVVVTTDMALLTELEPSLAPKVRAKCGIKPPCSKAWPRVLAGLCLFFVALFVGVTRLQAQPAATTHVLDLDGKGSYVELPPNLFTNDVVTVEGWVKWREFGMFSRFFDFADAALQICLNNRNAEAPGPTATVRVERYRAPAFDDLKVIDVSNVLSTNQWIHLAVVAGTNFSKLYFNGALVSSNEIPFGWHPTGIGMTAEQVAKLFQPFTQAEASTTRKYGGTGLGLAISKRFCQMMGSDLTVASELRKGSTFTVS